MLHDQLPPDHTKSLSRPLGHPRRCTLLDKTRQHMNASTTDLWSISGDAARVLTQCLETLLNCCQQLPAAPSGQATPSPQTPHTYWYTHTYAAKVDPT